MEDSTKLKSIILLSDLSDDMLEDVKNVTELVEYKPKEYIFKVGDPADYLYSVLEGKVQLEIDIESDNPIQLHGIVPNFTFGISSLVKIDNNFYTQNAKVIEKSKIFKWKAADLHNLFVEDYKLGYLFMTRIAKILKTRFTAKDTLIADFYKYVRSFGKSF